MNINRVDVVVHGRRLVGYRADFLSSDRSVEVYEYVECSHDVTQDDWQRYLASLVEAAGRAADSS